MLNTLYRFIQEDRAYDLHGANDAFDVLSALGNFSDAFPLVFGAVGLPTLQQQKNLNMVIWMRKIESRYTFLNITATFIDASFASNLAIGMLSMSSAPLLAYSVDDSQSISATLSSTSTVADIVCNVTVNFSFLYFIYL